MKYQWLTLMLYLWQTPTTAQAKVYWNINVGSYQKQLDLRDHKGQSFLSLMKEQIFPALQEASQEQSGSSAINSVRRGKGLELRLTDSVTTFHVNYKAHWEEKAERAGRSFSGVDHNPLKKSMEYVADSSYKHYLSSLEDLFKDPGQIRAFNLAILAVVLNCDSSGFLGLSEKGQRVAADFVAVYLAEQYRHLLSGKGQFLGKRHNWDDAHLQVTLLASFHGGQTPQNKAMFYKGDFRHQVYHQIVQRNCVYQKAWHDIDKNHWLRTMNLTDYWQFNASCDRSGVNLTRRDFNKMGDAITTWLIKNSQELSIETFNELLQTKWTDNFIDKFTGFIISNQAPRHFEKSEELIEEILLWLEQSSLFANEITASLMLRSSAAAPFAIQSFGPPL